MDLIIRDAKRMDMELELNQLVERLEYPFTDSHRLPAEKEAQEFLTYHLNENRTKLLDLQLIKEPNVPPGVFFTLFYLSIKTDDWKLFTECLNRCSDPNDLCQVRAEIDWSPVEVLAMYEKRYPLLNKTWIVYAALVTKNDDLLDDLLEMANRSNLFAFRNTDGLSLLHIAAIYGSPHAIERLLKIGFNVDERNRVQRTPLMEAIWNKRWSTMEALLGSGADVLLTSLLGNTAIHIAAEAGYTQAIAPLKEALHSREVSIDVPGNRKTTPLLRAICSKHKDTVEELLSLGADATLRFTKGYMPIHAAVLFGVTEIIAPLAKAMEGKGVSIDAVGEDGLTALTLAIVARKDSKIAKVLIDLGASLDILYREVPLSKLYEELKDPIKTAVTKS